MKPSWSASWRWLAALAMIAGSSAPARAGFTIADLGVIGMSGTSGAMAINASGVAAGMVTLQGGGMVAASSSGGGFGTITVPSGALTSMATSINGGGTVAGTYTDSNKLQHGFYSSGGVATAIGPMTSTGLTLISTVANGINDGGSVVGTGSVTSVGMRAFVSTEGVTTIINPLGTGTFNYGNGINTNGQVVGSSETSPGGYQNAFYTSGPGGAAIDLLQRNMAGNFYSNTYGTAIANDGDIAGYGNVGGSNHGFFAPESGGALVDLGTLANASSSQANAVNNNALVVGTSGSRAFLWGGPEGMYDLNSLIPVSDQANWVLTSATGINDGNQISGEGYFNGVLHGFVLTPIPNESLFASPGAVPTPPTMLLSAVGFAIAWVGSRGRSRRRDR